MKIRDVTDFTNTVYFAADDSGYNLGKYDSGKIYCWHYVSKKWNWYLGRPGPDGVNGAKWFKNAFSCMTVISEEQAFETAL